MPRALSCERDRLAEVAHLDTGTTRVEHAVAHLDDGCADDEERHHPDPDRGADSQREGRVDGRDHQSRHRCADRGGDQHPQRGAQPLAILSRRPDAPSILLHYPRCVTETVDVPIIAADVPVYAHPGDAGADLTAAEAVRLEPGRRALVGTGVRIALPDGYVAFVVPRSGLAARHGITIVNAPGTVDAGYRGEIKVSLLNTDPDEAFEIAAGDRIAQLIVMPVPRANFIEVDELPDSVRGEGGFGSTGYQKDGASA